jgi:signal transduction histidine kinase
MQVQHEQSRDEAIQSLLRQVEELQADNLLLKEQLAQKEQATAMIAHELRSPLSAVIGYAEKIVRSPQRVDTTLRSTSIIVGQAHRIMRLVNDLLDNALLTSGKFRLVRKPCDLVELAQEVMDRLRPLARLHTFILEHPDAPVMGNWDKERLQQVLGNLLENAVKYADQHTTITTSIHVSETTARVSIHNQGIGIPARNRDQLFHPYARLEATRMQQGAGLGLYIARCIIEAHSGELHLEPPTADGQGTTFFFDIPLT